MKDTYKIKKWMIKQDLENYFDGLIDDYSANYTQLGADASYYFNYKHCSFEDELCFDVAQDVLEKFIKRYGDA